MPVIITIDGPASSGKGSVAKIVAQSLNFHYLESGAIYRALGLWVYRHHGADLVAEAEVLKLLASLRLEFNGDEIYVNDQEVSAMLREESIGMLAARYGAMPQVRQNLLAFQRSFAREPGLVSDGRDMGSVVFPQADLKVFLTATAEKRAERRYKQLQQLGKSVTIEVILQDIIARDHQDLQRSTAPLRYDSSFKVLDNSALTLAETVTKVLTWFQELGLS